MKLQMQSVHFDADVKLIDFIQRRVDKLETFYDRIMDGEVIMRLDNNDQNRNKVVEIILNVPKAQLFAQAQSSSFEAATDEVVEALRRQIKKHKEKLISQ